MVVLPLLRAVMTSLLCSEYSRPELPLASRLRSESMVKDTSPVEVSRGAMETARRCYRLT